MTKEKNSTDSKPKIFKRYRSNVQLTHSEIKHIKVERKKLRKQLKKQGIRSKKDFELTAATLGLYFDKRRWGIIPWWLLGKGALWALLGSFATLLGVLYLLSTVTEKAGHFTINMSDKMFRNGFVLSETVDFASPQVQLFSDPVDDAPCISFAQIPENVDDHEGNHGEETYFAYTFFLRNEGEEIVDYHYELAINSESKDLSKAAWIMIFEDGQMKFFAKPNEGNPEVIPNYSVSDRGYPNPALLSQAAEKEQFEYIGTNGSKAYYRIVPINFDSDTIVEEKLRYDIAPMDVHKYTVIIWLEGDDPDCTNDLIGGHIGLEMNFQLLDDYNKENEDDPWKQIQNSFEEIIEKIQFWKD